MRMHVKVYKMVSESGERSGERSWRLILQYGSEPYTPVASAVGAVAEGNTGFAKLSDDDINALADFDDVYNYFKFTSSEEQFSGSGALPTMAIRTKLDFQDTKRGMGLVPASWCSGGDVTMGADMFCSGNWAVLNVFDTKPQGNCERWFTDYSIFPHCYYDNWDSSRFR